MLPPMPKELKERGNGRKNRIMMVNIFLESATKEKLTGRIEFGDLLRKLNLAVVGENVEQVSRIELSRCLAGLHIGVEHYRGAHITGRVWNERQTVAQIPAHIDPALFIGKFLAEQVVYVKDAVVSSRRMYACFSQWCKNHHKPLCTRQMFTKRLNWAIEPKNGTPDAVPKGNMTVYFDMCLSRDFDMWQESNSKKVSMGRRAMTIEAYTYHLAKCRAREDVVE